MNGETETLIRLKYGTPSDSMEYLKSLPEEVIDHVFNQYLTNSQSAAVLLRKRTNYHYHLHQKIYFLLSTYRSEQYCLLIKETLIRYHTENYD